MKWIMIALLIGIAIPVYALWRLEAKHIGSSGCLLPFILSVLVFAIGALLLTQS